MRRCTGRRWDWSDIAQDADKRVYLEFIHLHRRYDIISVSAESASLRV